MVCLMNALRRLIIFVLAAPFFSATPSLAITAELANKCRLMAIQAHPTPRPGSKNTGVKAAQRKYFSKCIANKGKMDTAEPDQDQGSAPSGAPPLINTPSTVPSEK